MLLPRRALTCTGPEAAQFLQAQLAADLRTLGPEGSIWAAYLSPAGRVLGLGRLWNPEDGTWHWLVDAGAAPMLAERLRRYLLRSRCRIELDPRRVTGWWPGEAAPAPSTLWSGDRRVALEDVSRPDDDLGRWLQADLEAGLPRLVGDRVDAFVPQMLALEALGAISLRKGCYPGQEVVARVHYRGATKRRPYLGRVSGPLVAVPEHVQLESTAGTLALVDWAATAADGLRVYVVATETTELPITLDTDLGPLPVTWRALNADRAESTPEL